MVTLGYDDTQMGGAQQTYAITRTRANRNGDRHVIVLLLPCMGLEMQKLQRSFCHFEVAAM